jgi:hypothetical protein
LTEKLDFDQQAANGVIDLVDEVNEGSQAQQAQGQTRVRDLTVAELGRLIESAVERAIRKSRE